MLTIKKRKGEIWSYFTKGEKLNSSHYKAKCMYCNLSVCGIVKSKYRGSSTLIYGGYKRNNKVYLQEK